MAPESAPEIADLPLASGIVIETSSGRMVTFVGSARAVGVPPSTTLKLAASNNRYR